MRTLIAASLVVLASFLACPSQAQTVPVDPSGVCGTTPADSTGDESMLPSGRRYMPAAWSAGDVLHVFLSTWRIAYFPSLEPRVVAAPRRMQFIRRLPS
jgi:hypothetical protein